MERGRSLSELGQTLRWSDLRAFMKHLPATSHLRRHLDPEAASRAELMTVDNQLVMEVHDALWEIAHARAGNPWEGPKLRDQLLGLMDPKSGDGPDKAPARVPLTASEIRQRMKELEN